MRQRLSRPQARRLPGVLFCGTGCLILAAHKEILQPVTFQPRMWGGELLLAEEAQEQFYEVLQRFVPHETPPIGSKDTSAGLYPGRDNHAPPTLQRGTRAEP